MAAQRLDSKMLQHVSHNTLLHNLLRENSSLAAGKEERRLKN